MEQSRINELTKEAQEKFEKAKADILAELERKLNEEEARKNESVCDCCGCKEDPRNMVVYVNEDAVHWDDQEIECRDVVITYEPGDNGEPERVCVQFDNDLENAHIQVVLLNALAELVVDFLGEDIVSFEEARTLVHSGWAATLLAFANNSVGKTMKDFMRDFLEALNDEE